MKVFFGVLLLVASVAVASAETNIVNCYFGSWAKLRTGKGKFTIDNINPNLCTHITYAFIGLTSTGDIDPMELSVDLPSFLALKQKNPNVKLLVSMGGQNESSAVFSKVTNDPTLCVRLVANIYKFVAGNGLDGFDLNWQYPGGAASDSNAFVEFLQQFRVIFSGTNILLTAAVAHNINAYAYNIKEMNKYLDYFNIMEYNFHTSNDGKTGINAPLVNSHGQHGDSSSCVEESITEWIKAGATPQKILLGLPFFGQTFTLEKIGYENENGVGAPISAAGPAGPYSQEPGFLEYQEVCLARRYTAGWVSRFTGQSETPYAYNKNTRLWISYDDGQSITLKIKYAINNNLGGVFIWTIESDDWDRQCYSNTEWPLLKTVDDLLGIEIVEPPTTLPPSTLPPTTLPPSKSSEESSVTPNPAPEPFVCSASGYFPSPDSCNEFYGCVNNGDGTFLQYPFTCPDKLVFNPKRSRCDYPANVPGC